jgi:hypothetical protein
MKQEYIEPDIKIEALDSIEILAGTGGVTGGGTASDIDYGGVDNGTHEPEAKISFTDIWADDEETVNVNWDSFD